MIRFQIFITRIFLDANLQKIFDYNARMVKNRRLFSFLITINLILWVSENYEF